MSTSSYSRHVRGYQIASVVETPTGLVIVLERIPPVPPPRPAVVETTGSLVRLDDYRRSAA